jgi:hypothetical protein
MGAVAGPGQVRVAEGLRTGPGGGRNTGKCVGAEPALPPLPQRLASRMVGIMALAVPQWCPDINGDILPALMIVCDGCASSLRLPGAGAQASPTRWHLVMPWAAGFGPS